jgi:hypothetical protein
MTSIPIRINNNNGGGFSHQQQTTQRPVPGKKSAVEKLNELEAEISFEARGMRVPSDPEFTDLMARLLATHHPNADLRNLSFFSMQLFFIQKNI